MLGFHVGFWDYVTFLVLAILVAAGLAVAVFVLGLPGRIAIARKHPEADAVYLMGWIGFLAVVPWIQALGWAFKPTTVIDIRYLPKETLRDTDAMIEKLTGKASPARSRRSVFLASATVVLNRNSRACAGSTLRRQVVSFPACLSGPLSRRPDRIAVMDFA